MENQPTTRQLVIFTVVLSFIVSVIGTILATGILGPALGGGEGSSPFVFNRPKVQTQKTTEILRQDELVVKTVEQTSPAVVSIVASKDVPVIEQFTVPLGGGIFGDDFGIPQFRQKGTKKQNISSGSGFIIGSDGLILTNKHVVIDTAAEYTVLLNDGRKKVAKVLARDPVEDLAILKIDGSGYPTLQLGDSSKIKTGQTAIAIGNTLGEFRNTVSVGVVSGLQRSIEAQSTEGTESLQELIQTDAAINLGNSGGPLLNLSGEVIGINTAVAQGAENVGFAILINKAKRDIDNVKKLGRIVYPVLGVRYVIITKDLAEKEKLGKDFGVLLLGDANTPAIVPGGPAEKAGLKERDIVFELNGERIDMDHSLATLIQKHQVGEEVRLKVLRDGKELEVKAKLEERK